MSESPREYAEGRLYDQTVVHRGRATFGIAGQPTSDDHGPPTFDTEGCQIVAQGFDGEEELFRIIDVFSSDV
jgi:hypothetical protein